MNKSMRVLHSRFVFEQSPGILSEIPPAIADHRFVREMQRRGYTELEYSWIDEHNWPSRRAGEKLGGRLHKRYCIYEKEIGGKCL